MCSMDNKALTLVQLQDTGQMCEVIRPIMLDDSPCVLHGQQSLTLVGWVRGLAAGRALAELNPIEAR